MSSLIWIIDDDSSIRWVLQKALAKAGHETHAFENGNRIRDLLKDTQPDVIITDIRMPGINGLDLLEILQQDHSHIPVIVITAHSDLNSAVESYRGGAFEYLPKPFDLDEAVRLVQRAVNQQPGRVEENDDDGPFESSELIGVAPAMQDVFRAIGRLAKSDVNVLICGESGTGKELVAHALHKHSLRGRKPLIAINTAAIPAELLESELFGHEKGAFTGAHERRLGRFEQAHEGTLFLDEIGDMPTDLQTRLLRVLSNGRFYRVGGRNEVEVDTRIIAATNQDLESRVKRGLFREDLYHRLNVIRLELPPLRERQQDIPLLAEYFLARCSEELKVEAKQLSQKAIERMQAFSWPGNVRQLENICRWITVMAASRKVGVEDLPSELIEDRISTGDLNDWKQPLKRTVEQGLKHGENHILRHLNQDFESVLLQTALSYTGGRKQEAAKRLGWGRNTLTRKLKELGIDSQ